MEVYMKFAIIGGDLRIVKLAEMLAKENNEVYVFGLEKADNILLEPFYRFTIDVE